jgi:hypothetical protein
MYSQSGQMAGAERWSQYGQTPVEIVSYWVKHPLSVLAAIANPGALRHLRHLLFLPLADPATLLTIGIPWIIYTTSSFDQQASLGGAYASMFVAFLFAGMMRTLSRHRAKTLANRDVVALVTVSLMLGINARMCPLPKNVSGLSSAHAALARLNTDISRKRVLAQGCLIPHLGRPLLCDMLGSPRYTAESDYDLVLLSPSKDPWPLDQHYLERLADELSHSKAWKHEEHGCLQVFRRKTQEPYNESPNQVPEDTARKLADPQY